MSVETPNPSPSSSTTPSSLASRGLRLFHWSDSSSSTEKLRTQESTSCLPELWQFQYKKESFFSPSEITRPSGDLVPPQPSSHDRKLEDKDDVSDSPPSQDSAYFSQSLADLTASHKDEVPTYSFLSSDQEAAAPVSLYKCLFTSCGSVIPYQASSQFHSCCVVVQKGFFCLFVSQLCFLVCFFRKWIQAKIQRLSRVLHTR